MDSETCSMERTSGKLSKEGFKIEVVSTGLGPYAVIEYKGQEITLSNSADDPYLHIYVNGKMTTRIILK